jgi:NAD(P)-dependent dehydrogenase (short-subunit alcohol dehydrogenase family)
METVLAGMEVPEAVVTSAGVCQPAAIRETTSELWDETVAVNLTGSFLIARSAVIAMKAAKRGGSVVLVGSEQSLIGVPNYTAYAATKAGLVGLMRAMAAELAPEIRVNLLCPGPVDTPMLHAEFALTEDPEQAREAEIQRVPLRRIATAGETAQAAMWLLQEATYATGSVLTLDGGTTGAFAAT